MMLIVRVAAFLDAFESGGVRKYRDIYIWCNLSFTSLAGFGGYLFKYLTVICGVRVHIKNTSDVFLRLLVSEDSISHAHVTIIYG